MIQVASSVWNYPVYEVITGDYGLLLMDSQQYYSPLVIKDPF